MKTFLIAPCLLLAGCTVLTDTSFSAEGGASPVFLAPWTDVNAPLDAGSDVVPVDVSVSDVPDTPPDVPLDAGSDVVLVDVSVSDVPVDAVLVDVSVPDAPPDVGADTTLDTGDDADAFVNPLDCECPEGYRRCSGSHLCVRSWCCIPIGELCAEYSPQPRCQEFYD